VAVLPSAEVEAARRLLSSLREAPLRRAASSAEALGAALINAHWRRLGLHVDTRPAQIVARPGARFVLPLVPLLAAALLGLMPLVQQPPRDWLFAALDLSAAVLLVADRLLSALQRGLNSSASQTIIAVRQNQQREAAPAAACRIILAVALDAPARPGLRRLLQGRTLRATLLRLLLLIPAVSGATALLLLPQLPLPAVAGLQFSSAVLLGLLTLWPAPLSTPDSNLAAQAAVSLAVERLDNLNRVELWAIAFGGGNIDERSVDQLLERFPFQRGDTVVLTVGPLSGPPLRVVRRAGLFEANSDFQLYALAERADRRDPLIAAEPSRRAAALPLVRRWLQRGYRVLQIDAHQRRRSAVDEAELVGRTSRLLISLVRLIEEDPDALRLPRQR
jgi:hypothetical protein